MALDNVPLDQAALVPTPETPAVVLPSSSEFQEMDDHLETLAQEVAHLRLSLLTETEDHQSTIKHLHHRLDVLTFSLMLIVLGLVSVGTWFFSSPQGLTLLRYPTTSTTSADPRFQELERRILDLQGGENQMLGSQVKALQEKVNTLDQQQTSVQALDAKVAELSKNANTRQQTITILAKALQDVINLEADTITPPPRDATTDGPTHHTQAETPAPAIEDKASLQSSTLTSPSN